MPDRDFEPAWQRRHREEQDRILREVRRMQDARQAQAANPPEIVPAEPLGAAARAVDPFMALRVEQDRGWWNGQEVQVVGLNLEDRVLRRRDRNEEDDIMPKPGQPIIPLPRQRFTSNRPEFLKFFLPYASMEEARLRLKNTIVKLDKYYMVYELAEIPGGKMLYLKDHQGSIFSYEMTNPDFAPDFRSAEPQYVQRDDSRAGYLMRPPQRLYQQGLNQRNCIVIPAMEFPNQREAHHMSLGQLLHALNETKYISVGQAKRNTGSFCLSPDWCFVNNEGSYNLNYRGRYYGAMNDGVVQFSRGDCMPWIYKAIQSFGLSLAEAKAENA